MDVLWTCADSHFSRREQPVVHRDICLGRQQRRACLPEHPHRYVVSLHLTKLYNRSSSRHSTVDTHAPPSMWQYPPKAIHRHLPLCQPHVPFLDKPRNMLTRARNLPHRLQQGPRPGRERPERPRRRAQDPADRRAARALHQLRRGPRDVRAQVTGARRALQGRRDRLRRHRAHG